MKTRGSARTVLLWPQLEEFLRLFLDCRIATYMLEGALPRRPRLLPLSRGQEAMLGDIQKTLDRVAIQAGFREPVTEGAGGEQRRDAKGRPMSRGTVRSKMFRHTYCEARLQTTAQGAPVSIAKVAQELGHGSEPMIRRGYGHLGQVRHRSEAVEYRLEQHVERLAGRASLIDTPIGSGGMNETRTERAPK